MEEKDLLKKINKESENNVPDVYGKILAAAKAEGLLKGNDDAAEVYSDGETVALGGVNRKAVAITTLAAVACVCLAVALPVALSKPFEGIPPVGDGGDKVVADIDLGDTYAYGAVTTARLAESFLNRPATTAKAMSARSVSNDEINEFCTYFSALDCFVDKDFDYTDNDLPLDKYSKSLTISGSRANGDYFSYSMYYTEYKIIHLNPPTNGFVDYYIEGVLKTDYGTMSLIGERTLSSSAADAEEISLALRAYPDLNDKTTYVEMLHISRVDGVPVTSYYQYSVFSTSFVMNTATAFKTDDEELVIKLLGGDKGDGSFTVLGKNDDGNYEVDYREGEETLRITLKAKDNGFDYVIPDYNDYFTYKDNGDGTYTVSGLKPDVEIPETLIIPDWFEGKPVIGVGESAFYNKGIKNVIVSEGITELGDSAFSHNVQLISVELPSTLTTIDDWAFSGCSNLSDINLPENLTQIGYSAFYNCSKLTDITFGSDLTQISEYAFGRCGLKSVLIPAKVTLIQNKAFYGCTSLESLTVEPGNTVYHSAGNCIIDTENKTLIAGCKTSVIPNDESVKYIGKAAFCAMGLTELNLPSNIESIDSSAFSVNAFTSLTLSEGLKEIGASAFEECSLLESVSLPDSLEKICGNAFSKCIFKSIHIPENVNEIEFGAFYNCNELIEITVDPNNTVYMSSCNCIIEKSTKRLTHACKTSIIPDDGSVEIIGEAAFRGFSIKELEIPATVKEIEKLAFVYCEQLESLLIPDSVTVIGSYAFQFCKSLKSLTLPEHLTEIADNAFSGCENLTVLTIPEGVTSIGAGAFAFCWRLEEVILPSTLTHLYFGAFQGCSSLKSLVIPEGVESLEWNALQNCYLLERIEIPVTVNKIDFSALQGCSSLKQIVYSGTCDEWITIEKKSNWDAGTGEYTVICSDGTLAKDGTVIN